MFRHFTRFLRPGAVRFDIKNERLPYGTVAVAVRNVDDVYSVIFVNRNETEQVIKFKMPGEGGRVTAAAQTTDSMDFGDVELPVVGRDGTFEVTLPARGVLSVQFTVEEEGRAVATERRERALFGGREDGREMGELMREEAYGDGEL